MVSSWLPYQASAVEKHASKRLGVKVFLYQLLDALLPLWNCIRYSSIVPWNQPVIKFFFPDRAALLLFQDLWRVRDLSFSENYHAFELQSCWNFIFFQIQTLAFQLCKSRVFLELMLDFKLIVRKLRKLVFRLLIAFHQRDVYRWAMVNISMTKDER